MVQDTGGVVQVTVGTDPIVVFAGDGGIHAFRDPGYEFEPIPAQGGTHVGVFDTGGRSFRADGTVWDGATGTAADGRHLERVPARRLFAFAWRDDHGDDAFLREP